MIIHPLSFCIIYCVIINLCKSKILIINCIILRHPCSLMKFILKPTIVVRVTLVFFIILQLLWSDELILYPAISLRLTLVLFIPERLLGFFFNHSNLMRVHIYDSNLYDFNFSFNSIKSTQVIRDLNQVKTAQVICDLDKVKCAWFMCDLDKVKYWKYLIYIFDLKHERTPLEVSGGNMDNWGG